jgi:hypothetical protein
VTETAGVLCTAYGDQWLSMLLDKDKTARNQQGTHDNMWNVNGCHKIAIASAKEYFF